MAISKEVLIQLGRDVNSTILDVKAQFAASTKEVFKWMAKTEAAIPGEGDQAKYRMLGILAEHGFPGAEKGAPTEVKRYGKMVTIRPWQWRAVSLEVLDAWASGAGPTPRVNVSAKTRELETRVERLEAQVEKLLAAPAVVVAQ